jgi:hypothetical protein
MAKSKGSPGDGGDEIDGGGSALEVAARRLDRAMTLLEGRMKALSDRADGGAGGLFDHDRSLLASELDAARARERDLHMAGQEASQALGKAIRGIRKALERTEEG